MIGGMDLPMDLPGPLAWLVEEAGASLGPDRFLAELGGRLLADGLPLAGGALTLAVPHPIIARRTWLWRAEAGALRRGTGETIRAALLCADLRDFTALSEATEPAAMIAALDAWFDRVAGAVHAFGGEVLKFIGDGVLAIFPVTGAPAEACEAALRALVAARPEWPISMRCGRRKGCRRCPSARRCISARCCGAISARPTGWSSPRSAPRSI